MRRKSAAIALCTLFCSLFLVSCSDDDTWTPVPPQVEKRGVFTGGVALGLSL